MSMVRKALIPAAGLGTRMRPVSAVVPKELLPIGTRPALQYALDEATGAGLSEVGVVLRAGKELIRAYLEQLAAGDDYRGLELHFIEQEEPTGLADALLVSRDFLADEPFALLLPDNVLLSPEYRLADMVNLHRRTELDVIGVIELGSEDSGRYGNSGRIDYEVFRPGVLAIYRLQDKRPGTLEIEPGETIMRTCGRYVCRPLLLDVLEEIRQQVDGECSEVPAYQQIIQHEGAMGLVLPPPLFDVGNPRGYLAANAYLHERGG